VNEWLKRCVSNNHWRLLHDNRLFVFIIGISSTLCKTLNPKCFAIIVMWKCRWKGDQILHQRERGQRNKQERVYMKSTHVCTCIWYNTYKRFRLKHKLNQSLVEWDDDVSLVWNSLFQYNRERKPATIWFERALQFFKILYHFLISPDIYLTAIFFFFPVF
jgi:hypothetical protein